MNPQVKNILRNYQIPACNCIPLGNAGGFSGSRIWRIEATDGSGTWCLKLWPSGFSDDKRLSWIHDILVFAQVNGCPEVAAPVKTKSGTSFVTEYDQYWELTKWAEGTADFWQNPHPHKVASALETMARFHQATARYHLNFASSQNVAKVFDDLRKLDSTILAIERKFSPAHELVSQSDWEFYKRFAPKLATELAQYLVPLAAKQLPVQPVIRDIRDEHLFFENNRVLSIIDFGAMRIDTVACDLSRMLGSLIGHDRPALQKSLDDYSSLRQLSNAERELIIPLINAGIILGIANWLTWIFIEGRQFESQHAVQKRIHALMERLRNSV